jgi:hypothetical protein
MQSPRHDPVIAFLVGALGIATFPARCSDEGGGPGGNDAFWRSLAGAAAAGALFTRKLPPV